MPAKGPSTKTIIHDIVEHTTTVCHVFIFGISGFLVYLCGTRPWDLLAYHVLLYTIGWVFLFNESVLFITKDNIMTKFASHPTRVLLHWVALIVGTILSLAGLICAIIIKAGWELAHFETDHAITGLIATVLALPSCLNGVLALFAVDAKRYIKPNLNKAIHDIFGIATIFIGAYCTVTGYYTVWFDFRSRNHPDVKILSIVITILFSIWVLVRPTINFFDRIISLCK